MEKGIVRNCKIHQKRKKEDGQAVKEDERKKKQKVKSTNTNKKMAKELEGNNGD